MSGLKRALRRYLAERAEEIVWGAGGEGAYGVMAARTQEGSRHEFAVAVVHRTGRFDMGAAAGLTREDLGRLRDRCNLLLGETDAR